MSGTYEVLTPWAEVDLVPLKGISPRLDHLRDKRIGLFHNNKLAAAPILDAVETELRSRFEGLTIARFGRTAHEDVAQTSDRTKYEEWLRGLDGVVLAVGD